MSDTDKTRPTWVQMLDPTNKGWLEEHHNHINGRDCDIENTDVKQPWIWRSNCTKWPSQKAGHEGIYPRPGKMVEWYTYKNKRRERAAWRTLKRRAIKGDLDAADESPLTYSHRHSALWDAF